MNDEQRRLITANAKRLADVLDLNSLVDGLVYKGVFSSKVVHEMGCFCDPKQRIMVLLSQLCKSGPLAYESFIQVLRETQSVAALELLNASQDCGENDPDEAGSNYPLSGPPSSGGNLSGWMAESEATNEVNFGVKVRRSKTPIYSRDAYKMSAKPRGFALIVNNVNFDGGHRDRSGSEQDARRFDHVFKMLGFTTFLREDLKAGQMEDWFTSVASHEDLQNHDAFVLVVLSHGLRHCLFGTDGATVLVDTIFETFDQSEGLKGKPKLFFFQACRGVLQDRGVPDGRAGCASAQETNRVRQVMGIPKINVPRKDMFVAYSSVIGYESYKQVDGPSFFGKSLAHNLARCAHDTDLAQILTHVTHEVTNLTINDTQKQSPQVDNHLCKLLYFNPGLYRL